MPAAVSIRHIPAIGWLLAVFFGVGLVYAVVTPLFDVSD